MSKIVKAMNKSKQLSGQFQVEDRDPLLDQYSKIRGRKARIVYALAQDLKILGATKTLTLATEEEFAKNWGAVKANMQYVRNLLREYGIERPVVVQHDGKIKVWAN